MTPESPHQARILIADDESLIRLHLREMLTDLGYDVVAEATSGDVALDLARKVRPDLLLVDIKMPGMDGLEAARLALAEKLAPVILLTAYSDDELIADAKSAGVSGYLVKPIRETDLAPAIEIALVRFAEVQDLERKVFDLEDALETRKLIERAKGVLMEAYGLSESEAFNRMRKTSMDNRRSMREVSEAILLSQEVQSSS